MSEKECPKCRGTGWCPGEEVDDEIICSKCGGRGTLRNTTNPAPQEKNSAPLLSGGESVKTNTPTDELVGGTQHGVGAPSGSTKHTLGKEDAHG
jgi:uncharacterized Zn finger protein (UPF0148 family)